MTTDDRAINKVGSDKWWTGVVLTVTAVGMGLTYGGTVTAKTKKTIQIATAGAILAVIADRFVNPKLGLK